MRSPDFVAHAFDWAWEWTYDRKHDAQERFDETLGDHVLLCSGSNCCFANQRATPLWRVLIGRYAPPSADECDMLDRDRRYRLWQAVHVTVSNLSVRLGANDWPRT